MKYKQLLMESQEEYSLLEDKIVIAVGSATCGRSAGAQEISRVFMEEIADGNLDVEIIEVGCIGLCYIEPVITIIKPGHPAIFYGQVTKKLARQLVKELLQGNNPMAEYALGTIGAEEIKEIPDLFETPVMKPQVRRILRNCGLIDPSNIKHYIARGGYSGLNSALKTKPEMVIEQMKSSGLRGRGGAGFPTWMKWQFCVDSEADEKYLICNADEGDPGAFMNRSLLESDPHSVLEGIVIASYAIGAKEAYIYCRAEYPLALERLKHAISEMREMGLLGENILETGFHLDVKIKEGAGAFVCGEETALIASIEGKRGMPRTRPPFPTTAGLWGKPTVINNVETMASVSLIMKEGHDHFKEFGTVESKGTKTFSLVGNVKKPGLIEVPLGTTLREVIYDIGGGINNEGKFKAVQIGGPSGGCLPEEFLDTKIDYDSLTMAGAIMGSGGLVVMDQNSCMVDVARYFLEFIQNESCGKCVPCRLGTKQMLDILSDITTGKGKQGDIDLLRELSQGIRDGSLCGLGQTSPNPILTTLKYFGEEYISHIENKRCKALLCKELIDYNVIEEKCEGCMLCLKSCPVGAVSGTKKHVHSIDTEKCIKCGTCIELCSGKYNAIERVSKY